MRKRLFPSKYKLNKKRARYSVADVCKSKERTERLQRIYLNSIASGWSEAQARAQSGISLKVAQYWVEEDVNSFVDRLEEANDDARGVLEDFALARSFESDAILSKVLEAKSPAFRKDRDSGGGITVVINSLLEPEQPMKVVNNTKVISDE